MRRRAGDLFFAPWWKTSSRSLSYFSICRRCWFSRISRRFSSTRISSSPKSVSPFFPFVKILPRIDMSFLEHDLGRLLLTDRGLGFPFLFLHGADLFLLLDRALGHRLRLGALHLPADLLDPPGEHELAGFRDVALAFLEELLLRAVELFQIGHGAAAARLVPAARLLEEHEGLALVAGPAIERRHLLGEVLHAQH